MSRSIPRDSRPLVTSGTASWERDGTEREREQLEPFLADVAATPTIQSAIARSVAFMRVRSGAAVLDVGCGTGTAFPALAAAIGPAGRITGIDHAAGFLETAQRDAENAGYGDRLTLVIGDAHDLPFPDGAFDAARTERVLMHVDDPDRVLRELRRVVRPGGRVVCVEPDLAGMRVDGEDVATIDAVVAGFCASIRHPAMGLALNRRMAAAGLADRLVETLTEVVREFDADTAEFFARAAQTAVERGWVYREAADAVLATLRQADAAGAYTSYSSMFVVAGRVPD